MTLAGTLQRLAPRPYSTQSSHAVPPSPLSASTSQQDTSSTESILEPLTDEYLRVVLPRRGKYRPVSPPWPSLMAAGKPRAEEEDAVAKQLAQERRERRQRRQHKDALKAYRRSSSSTLSSAGQVPHAAHRRDRRVSRPHMSDVVVQLLQRDDDVDALRLLREIKAEPDVVSGAASATGPKVIHHRAYLEAAIRALKRGGGGGIDDLVAAQRESLEWLACWHSFGVTEYLPPAVGRQLEPLIDVVLAHDRLACDLPFLEDLLRMAANKGFLPALAGSIWRHYSWLAPPERSFALLSDLVTSFSGGTRKSRSARRHHLPRSETAREKARAAAQAAHRRALIAHAARWRNVHLRAVLEAGHVEAAKAIFEAGVQAGVSWTEGSKAALARRLQQLRQGQQHRAAQEMDEVAAGYAASYEVAVEDVVRLTRAAARGKLRSVTTLARLLDVLDSHRPSLVRRLEARYVVDVTPPRNSSSSSRPASSSFWWLAQMVRLQRRREHRRAVDVYATHFRWLGLPFERSIAATPSTRRLLYPSRPILTHALVSLLDLERDLSLPRLLDIYEQLRVRSMALPSTLHPDAITHLAITRCAARRLGARDAEAFCTELERKYPDIDVGIQAWSAVAVAWAKERRARDVERVLERLRGAAAGSSTGSELEQVEAAYARVKAVERAHLGAATTLLRKKETGKATRVLEAMSGSERSGKDVGQGGLEEDDEQDVKEVRRVMAGSLGV